MSEQSKKWTCKEITWGIGLVYDSEGNRILSLDYPDAQKVVDRHNSEIVDTRIEKSDSDDLKAHGLQPFLIEHLRIWKDEGIPAPVNELQSIQAWLQYLGKYGEEKTKQAMRNRMLLLLDQAHKLNAAGPEVEDSFEIYSKRPRSDFDSIKSNINNKESEE